MIPGVLRRSARWALGPCDRLPPRTACPARVGLCRTAARRFSGVWLEVLLQTKLAQQLILRVTSACGLGGKVPRWSRGRRVTFNYMRGQNFVSGVFARGCVFLSRFHAAIKFALETAASEAKLRVVNDGLSRSHARIRCFF